MGSGLRLREEIEASIGCLDELESLLRQLPSGLYGQRVPALKASIGSHTRHILEHFDSVVLSVASGLVHFEVRARDRRVEAETQAALDRIAELRGWFERASVPVDAALATRVSLDGNLSDYVEFGTSFRRELIYAFLHAVHHMATIAIACELLGSPAPEQFGVAPATRVHRLAEAQDRP
jgi:hypothetical protein